MFWKIAKVMGDLSSIHLFSAEPITRILVVSFFPFLSVVGCVSRRRRISFDLLIASPGICVILSIPDRYDTWRHKAISAPQLVRRAEAGMSWIAS